MKFLAWSLSGAALAVFVTGCQPDLAQVKPGSQEEYWEQFVDRSYSGFRPSRTAPPAIADKVSPELREAEQQQLPAVGTETETEQLPAVNAADVAPADDPVTVEVAGEKPAVIAPETGAKADDKAQKPEAEKAGEVKAAGEKKPAAAASNSVVYVVKPGDTLSFISKKFYHNAGRYDLIMKANPQLSNPNALRPGMKLQIPQL